MRRSLRDGEALLWAETMRGVRPLKGRPPSSPTAPPQPASAIASAPPPARTPPQPRSQPAGFRPHVPPVEIGARNVGLDTTSWRALSNGRLRVERRLDLHGQVAQSAFVLLHAFLLRARADRLRCVEIITGAGSGTEGGILRRELPHWLSRPDLRHLVLAAVHPHAANVGSVRLLLRRRQGPAPNQLPDRPGPRRT